MKFLPEIKSNRESILFGLTVFLIAIAYLYPFVRVLNRVGDEGLFVYGAELVAGGALPYRDFVNEMGPLSFYWLALFFKIFGIKIIVARILLLLTGAFTATLIYWLTRRLYRGAYDFVPALFYTLISIPLWTATSHHWDSNLFFLLSFGACLLWQDSRRMGYLVAAGILAGITSCGMQQKGFFLFVALLTLLFCEQHYRKEKFLEFCQKISVISLGYFGVVAAVIILFYIAGGLKDLINGTFLLPLNHYLNLNTVPYAYGLFEYKLPYLASIYNTFLNKEVSQALSWFSLLPLLITAGLPLIIIVTAAACSTPARRTLILNINILPFWFCGAALWISEFHRMDLMHLIYGSPILIILIFYFFKVMLKHHKKVWHITMSFIILSLITLGMINLLVASSAKTSLITRRGHIYAHKEDPALMFLMEHTKANEEVFIYPYYPMYYFLANVKNPTRYNAYLHAQGSDVFFKDALESIKIKKVKYVLWDTVVDGENLKKWFPNYQHPRKDDLRLERYLESNYHLLGIKNGFRIMERIENNDSRGE